MSTFNERIRQAYGHKWEPFIGHASRYIQYCDSTEAQETWSMLEEPLWGKCLDNHSPLPARILDYGAGFGKVVDVVLRRVRGPDSIPDTIDAYEPNTILRNELQRRYGQMSFVNALQTFEPKLSRGEYGLVTSNMVFNHLSNKVHKQTLRDIHLALAPGGTLAYVIPYPQRKGRDGQEFIDETPWGGFVTYYHRSTQSEQRALYETGFIEVNKTIQAYNTAVNPHVPLPANPKRKRVLITARKSP